MAKGKCISVLRPANGRGLFPLDFIVHPARAIKHPGRMQRAAKAAGMSTQAYMRKHEGDKGSLGAAARLGIRLSRMHKK